jgi:hypothetical protein
MSNVLDQRISPKDVTKWSDETAYLFHFSHRQTAVYDFRLEFTVAKEETPNIIDVEMSISGQPIQQYSPYIWGQNFNIVEESDCRRVFYTLNFSFTRENPLYKAELSNDKQTVTVIFKGCIINAFLCYKESDHLYDSKKESYPIVLTIQKTNIWTGKGITELILANMERVSYILSAGIYCNDDVRVLIKNVVLCSDTFPTITYRKYELDEKNDNVIIEKNRVTINKPYNDVIMGTLFMGIHAHERIDKLTIMYKLLHCYKIENGEFKFQY